MECWNTSGYDRDLFEMVLRSVQPDDPVGRVMEVLLWRGFLVERRGDVLFLASHYPRDDLMMLRRFGILREHPALLKEAPLNEPFPILSTSKSQNGKTLVSEESLFKLFATTVRFGMSGPFDYGGRVNESWGSFLRLQYGPKVPVRSLDPGIALLVKTMPLLGLHTAMSCDGHTREPPVITFFSRYHLSWASLALPQFMPKNDAFAAQWRFGTVGGGWSQYQWHLGIKGCGRGLKRRFELYSNIQRLCRNIMYAELAAEARACKQRLTHPKDLQDSERCNFSG